MSLPPSPGTRAVLEERARVLARPLPRPAADAPRDHVLVAAGGRRCALDAGRVLLVGPLPPPAAVGPVPPPWLGLVVVQGSLHAALELATVLGGTPAGGERAYVLVASTPATVALAVDEVLGVLPLPAGAVLAVPGAGTGAPGVVGTTGDFVTIVDPDRLVRGLAPAPRPQEAR